MSGLAQASRLLVSPGSCRAAIRAEKQRRAEERKRLQRLPLVDLVHVLSPRLQPPTHLRLIADRMEHCHEQPFRLVASCPFQHGKTQLTLAGLAMLLSRERTWAWRNAYVTYSIDRARHVMTDPGEGLHRLVDNPRLKLTRIGDQLTWWTQHNGGVRATGVDGGLAGAPIDGLMVADDLIKNWEEAQSATRRDHVDNWFRSVALARCHESASILVIATRWHEDDLSGRLIAEGWPCLNLPAIAEEDDPNGRAVGEALAPSIHSKEYLEQTVRPSLGGEDGLMWNALEQGHPRPGGGFVFHGATTYAQLPDVPLRWAIGIDLAYTESTRADWSIALTGAMTPDKILYLTDCVRRQVEADVFGPELVAAHLRQPSARIRWYAGGGAEKALGKLLPRLFPGVRVNALPATTSKLVRAMPTVNAWNQSPSRILVPENAPWVPDFLRVVNGFVGQGDEVDDDVDALSALFDELDAQRVGGWGKVPLRR